MPRRRDHRADRGHRRRRCSRASPLGTPQQTWQYRADLTIFYGGDTTLNLCIQNVTATYGHAGTPELEPCATSGSGTTYPYANQTQQEQEFAYNDGGQLEAPDVNTYWCAVSAELRA